MVKSAENRMHSNLERFTDSMSIRTFSNSYPTKLVPNFRLWMLKIDSKSQCVQTYTMGLTISLNRVSSLPTPVRYNIFYEIDTSSTGLYNTGLGAQSTGPHYGEKSLKTTENLGLGPPICPLFWENLDPPPFYFEKKI